MFEKNTAKRIRASNGVQAEATILTASRGHDVHETGVYGAGTVHWKMTVRVEVIGIAPFEASVEGELPADQSYGPGLKVPVLFDPSKTSRIAFDDMPAGSMSGFGRGTSAQSTRANAHEIQALMQTIMSNPGSAASKRQELLAALGTAGVAGGGLGGGGLGGGATVFVNGQQVSGPGMAGLGAAMPGSMPGSMPPAASGSFPGSFADANAGAFPGAQPASAQPAGPAPSGANPPGAPGPAGADPVQLLTQLAQLRAQGLIDDAEFAAQKARILGGG